MPLTLRMTFQAYAATPAITIATPAPSYVIEVLTTSFDAEQTLSIGSTTVGAGAGKVTFNPFSFAKRPDLHSADFWSRLCSGTPFQKVTLTAAASPTAPQTFSFTMSLVAVKTMALTVSESDAAPTETITLEYGGAAYSVTPANTDGTFGAPVASGWDRVRNVAIDPSKIGTL
jgi:type VI secretion system secreted protein Hcp